METFSARGQAALRFWKRGGNAADGRSRRVETFAASETRLRGGAAGALMLAGAAPLAMAGRYGL